MTPKIFAPTRRVAAILATAGLFSLLTGSVGAQHAASAVPDHPDARTVLHVLNRVTFGPRPGDIERVEKMGITAYIDEQLHPDKIDDTAMTTRLADFSTLTMSSRDLVRPDLPARAAGAQGRAGQAAKAAQKEAKSASAVAGDPSMTMDPNAPKPPAQPGQAQLPPEVRMLQQQQQNVMQRADAGEDPARGRTPIVSSRKCSTISGSTISTSTSAKGQVRQYLTEYERDVIRPHVLGQLPRSARRDRAQPGDALLSRQLAERDGRTRSRCSRPNCSAG